MKLRHASLRWRVATAMIVTALATSLLFGLASFVFLYTIEDRVFSEALTAEVTRQKRAWGQRGALVPALRDHTAIYRRGDRLPADLQAQFHWAGAQTEYYGEGGRHYHVERFQLPAAAGRPDGQAVAVAEVSRYLLVRPRRQAIILLLAGLTAIVALFAGAIGYVLARQSVAPLSRLAANVSSKTSEVPEIDPASYPSNEIGVLALALNQSLERVRTSVKREKAFTRDVSHELRTPLAVIRSGAELASAGAGGPPQARQALSRIIASVRDAEQTLDLLLALARDPGKAARSGTARVLPLVEKAVLDSSSRYPGQAISLSVVVDPRLEIAMPRPATQLVLNNLIGNAFQHAPESELRITAGPDWIEIADTGPGLGQADPFGPFHKGQSSRGSGLGLDIVKRLCEHSRINLAVSGDEATGTRFRLTFPRATA